jgi:GNAT superfamily N-acetyltransferase
MINSAEPMSVRIRTACTPDLDAMVGLIEQLFALEPDYGFDAAKVRRGLGLLLNSEETAALWVAELDGQVVGMCSAQIVISTAEGGRVAWVEDVVVRHDLHGSGIGRRLLDAVSTWAKRHGISRLQLLADAENAAALNFYRRLDWQTTRMICLRQRPGE